LAAGVLHCRTLPTDATLDRITDAHAGRLGGAPAGRDAPQTAWEGRQNEHTMDALALRADEGRGTAPICSGEPLTGCDPEMSE
jgi:hypothetical protein